MAKCVAADLPAHKAHKFSGTSLLVGKTSFRKTGNLVAQWRPFSFFCDKSPLKSTNKKQVFSYGHWASEVRFELWATWKYTRQAARPSMNPGHGVAVARFRGGSFFRRERGVS